MNKTILILGGYGNAGKLIAKLLLEHTSVNIIIAGRNEKHANEVAVNFNKVFAGERVSYIKLDAASLNELTNGFGNIDLVIVASSTLDYTENVVKAAIEASTDYFDIQLSTPEKINVLRSYESKMKEKNLCFITDGGFHPGVPAAMVRYGGSHLYNLRSANVYSYINIDWSRLTFSNSTGRELIEELSNYNPEIFANGRWTRMKWYQSKKIDFSKNVGNQYCAAMKLEEMKYLPEMIPTLIETGFYVSGFNWFVNYFVMPFAIPGIKIAPKILSKPVTFLFEWGLKKFSNPPFITILQLQARGNKGEQNTEFLFNVSHSDGYLLTAAPAVACLLQYLDGSIKKAGLHFQALAVDTERFFEDMKKMGIFLESKIV